MSIARRTHHHTSQSAALSDEHAGGSARRGVLARWHSIELRSCRHRRVHAQAGKAGGAHVIEQQKKRQQKQAGGSETSPSLDSARAVSIDVVEAHIPTTCARTTFLLPCAGCYPFSHAHDLVRRMHRWPSLPREWPLWRYLTNGGGDGGLRALRLQSLWRRRRGDCWCRRRPRLRQPSPTPRGPPVKTLRAQPGAVS